MKKELKLLFKFLTKLLLLIITGMIIVIQIFNLF